MESKNKNETEYTDITFTYFPVTRLSGKDRSEGGVKSEESNPLTTELWAVEAQRLVKADDPAEIARMQAVLKCTQDEAVNHFLERSCCSEDLPDFVGGKGTPQERRSALRALWRAYEHAGAEKGYD
jgi:hypothetical protein